MARAWLGALTASTIARAATAANAIFFAPLSVFTVIPHFLLPLVRRVRGHGDSPRPVAVTSPGRLASKQCVDCQSRAAASVHLRRPGSADPARQPGPHPPHTDRHLSEHRR